MGELEFRYFARTPQDADGSGITQAHHMGIRRLRHLRDFTLAVDLCHKPGRCSSQEFRIQFDEQRGLSLLDVELEHQHEDVRQDVMSWQLAATELRRTSLVWKGEGIMDFFMENNVQEFWSSSCFTYSWASEEEQMEIYEREELGREWLTIG